MNVSEKIIVGSTAVIVTSTIAMIMIGRKYDKKTDNVLLELNDINHTLMMSRNDIILGNKKIFDSNQILRKLVVDGAKDVSIK